MSAVPAIKLLVGGLFLSGEGEAILASRAASLADPVVTFPTIEDGFAGVAMVDAVLRSSAAGGVWVPVELCKHNWCICILRIRQVFPDTGSRLTDGRFCEIKIIWQTADGCVND
jgi:hypothetical protein